MKDMEETAADPPPEIPDRSWRRSGALLAVVATLVVGCTSTPEWYQTRNALPDCGEESWERVGGPVNAEARECFLNAIETGGSAELRIDGFDEEGGKLVRTLRVANGAFEEMVQGDAGWAHYICTGVKVEDNPSGVPAFGGTACAEAED